jgi:hypothetical protein
MESVAYDCRKKSISQTTTLWTYIMKRANYSQELFNIKQQLIKNNDASYALYPRHE